jgi:hypothetical protein
MWLSSGKRRPLLVLVAVPFAVSVFVALLYWYGYYLIELVNMPAIPGGGTVHITMSRLYFISFVTFIFSFIPINYNTIKLRGIDNLIFEYKYVKIILYIEIPLLVFATVIKAATFIELLSIDNNTLILLINGLIVNLGISVTAGIIYIILQAVRVDLRYYFAKACFEAIPTVELETRKANYLIKGIKFYDKYLRRTLNLQINDVKRIYSKILSDSNIDKNETMQLIVNNFNSDDKLKPLKFLSRISNIQESEKFLIDESLGQKIKDMAAFFATTIPIAIAIIQLFLQK